MTAESIYQIIDSNRGVSGVIIVFIYIFVALLFGYLISNYISKIYRDDEENTWLYPVSGRIVNFFEKVLGENKNKKMKFREYFINLLIFNAAAGIIAFITIYFQRFFPFYDNNRMGLSLTFNTVVSFLTNTNLEHFSNPFDLSMFSWTFSIMGLMFLSAATGFAASMAFVRGIRNDDGFIVNFYHDFLVSLFYLIFPLSILAAIIFILAGVPQTLKAYIDVYPLFSSSPEKLPLGPIATFIAIKYVGTNGGGIYGANAAYPLGNPNWFTNIVSYILMIIIPTGSIMALGRVFIKKFANMLVYVLFTIFTITSLMTYLSEFIGIPSLSALGNYSGNMIGKEVYLGLAPTTMFQVVAVFTSTGATSGAIISYTPIGILGLLINLVLNDPLGGVGTGVINIFTYVIFTVFISSLMVGKLPEIMSIRIGSKEMKYSTIALLSHPLIVLIPLGITLLIPGVMETFLNGHASNITNLLYEFVSAASNNGSEAGGFLTNSKYFNYLDGFIMLLGRYLILGIQLLLAQQFAFKKPKSEYTRATIDIGSPAFGFMLFAVIIMIGLLSYLPVFALGPLYSWAKAFGI